MPGEYKVIGWTSLTGDADPTNDYYEATFTVTGETGVQDWRNLE